jgi:hypothetical protein
MRKIISTARWSVLFLTLVLGALALPMSAFAADGEITNMADSDSVHDPYVGGDGRPTMSIEYLRDCAAGGITDCWVEVQWVSKCPEIWCGWVYGAWQRIPASGLAKGPCLGSGNEDNQWAVNYRTAYVASGTKTVQWKGENEWTLLTSGSFAWRMLTEAMFNVSASAGYSGGVVTETVTAISDYGPIVQAASTGGVQIHTC